MLKTDTSLLSRGTSKDNSRRSQSRDKQLFNILQELLASRDSFRGAGQHFMTADVSKTVSNMQGKSRPPLPPKLNAHKKFFGTLADESTQSSEMRITKDFFRKITPNSQALPVVEHPGSEYNKENNNVFSNKQLPPMYQPRNSKSPQKPSVNSSIVVKRVSNQSQDSSAPLLVRSNSIIKKSANLGSWKLPSTHTNSTASTLGNRSKTPVADVTTGSRLPGGNQVVRQGHSSPSIQPKPTSLAKFKAIIDRSKQVSGRDNIQTAVEDLPRVSSKFWIVFDHDSNEPLFGYKHSVKREIASLTKIATLYTALKIVEEERIDIGSFECVISYNAASKIGTSANLKAGDKICFRDLLYGTKILTLGAMLPSGNDAAQSISECLGPVCFKRTRYPDPEAYKRMQSRKASDNSKYFIEEMNSSCAALGLFSTTFVNSHGLMCQHNQSSALDVATILRDAFNKYPLFRQIVSTK